MVTACTQNGVPSPSSSPVRITPNSHWLYLSGAAALAVASVCVAFVSEVLNDQEEGRRPSQIPCATTVGCSGRI